MRPVPVDRLVPALRPVRALALPAVLLLAVARPAAAGELDLNLGLQATTTGWPADHGGGPTLDLGYWFRSWIGAKFVGKEQFATVDERFMTYLSANAAVRRSLGSVRITSMLGLVHQHEETRAALMEQPFSSVLGIGDGIRHRAGGRAGLSLAVPIKPHAHGDWYLAFDLDATLFTEQTRGPQWMSSGGISIGFTYDFAATKGGSR